MCLAAGSAESRHPSPDSEMNQPINTDRTFDISAAAGNPDDDVTVTSLASAAAAANSGLVQGGPDVAAAAEDDGNVSTGTSIDFDEQTPATTQTVGRTASSKDDATGVSNAISVGPMSVYTVGKQNCGRKLMARMLSNLNRFTELFFAGSFLGKLAVNWLLKIPCICCHTTL